MREGQEGLVYLLIHAADQTAIEPLEVCHYDHAPHTGDTPILQ